MVFGWGFCRFIFVIVCFSFCLELDSLFLLSYVQGMNLCHASECSIAHSLTVFVHEKSRNAM